MEEYKLPQELTDELDRGVFISATYDFMFFGDGIKAQPHVSFVEVKTDKLDSGDSRFEDAVRLYLKIRGEIDAVDALHPKDPLDHELLWFRIGKKLGAWDPHFRDNIFFIISPEEAEKFKRLKTQSLLDLCRVNHIDYVVKDPKRYLGVDKFLDLATGCIYELTREDIPGMCDDAATYHEYNLKMTFPIYR